MGGHGHEPPYKIPHYSQFQVKGIPELEELEKVLAQKGLRDPWIRNEAWRFNPAFGSKWFKARKIFFRGFSIGLALTVMTVGVEKMMGGDEHGHGHGHGDH